MAFNAYRAKAKAPNRKRDDALFLFLCERVAADHSETRCRIDNKRLNLLTIMSFCFLGELTFLGAAYETIGKHGWLICMTVISLAVWILAFCIAAFSKSRLEMYYSIPGYTDGLIFLPTANDLKNMKWEVRDPYDLDVFFMRRALKTMGFLGFDEKEEEDESKVLRHYQAAIENFDIGGTINKPAWLASSVHMERAEIENLRRQGERYKWLYGLFVANIVLLFAVAIACACYSGASA